MAKVTIIMEGDVDEVLPVLQRLSGGTVEQRGLSAGEPEVLGETQAQRPSKDAGIWTEEKVQEVWQDLKPDAQRILKEYATEPEGISWEALQHRLDLTPRQIGGRLSSLGHNLRKHGFHEDYAYPLLKTEGGLNRLDAVWQKAVSRMGVGDS